MQSVTGVVAVIDVDRAVSSDGVEQAFRPAVRHQKMPALAAEVVRWVPQFGREYLRG